MDKSTMTNSDTPTPPRADQAAPERTTMTIWAEPTRDEIIGWANTALRNSEIDYIDEALIEDFADGLSALRADLAAPSAPVVHPSLALESSEMPYRIFTDSSRIWMDDSDGGSLFAYVREGAAPSAPAEVEGLVERLRVKGRQDREQANHHIRRMEVERIEAATALTALQAENERLKSEVEGYREWGDDIKCLTRSLDVEMHGEEMAAKQASLCDLIGAGKELRARAEKAEAVADQLAAPLKAIVRLDREMGRNSTIHIMADEALAANAKLKGEA